MSFFVVYETSTGRVTKVVAAHVGDPEVHAGPGESVLVSPSVPNGPMHVDVGAGVVAAGEVDTRTVDQARVAKAAQIDAWQLQASKAGFVHAGKRFATDELSMLYLVSTAAKVARTAALPVGWVGGWRTADNEMVAVEDVSDWDALFNSMYQQGLQNFNHAQELRAQLAAATTVAEVEAIQWGESP